MAGTLVLLLALGFWLFGASSCRPRVLAPVADLYDRWREQRKGPSPAGPPIEQLAADLRRLIAEHDRILRCRGEWHAGYHLRVCENALHDRAEEAAKALGLPSCPAPLGGWTTVHLRVRLRALAEAGLVLPDYAGLA